MTICRSSCLPPLRWLQCSALQPMAQQSPRTSRPTTSSRPSPTSRSCAFPWCVQPKLRATLLLKVSVRMGMIDKQASELVSCHAGLPAIRACAAWQCHGVHAAAEPVPRNGGAHRRGQCTASRVVRPASLLQHLSQHEIEELFNMCWRLQVEQLEAPAAQIDGGDFFWAEPPKPKVCRPLWVDQ